jgi:3-mercaptopyruvate sulfurtransferase SseA
MSTILTVLAVLAAGTPALLVSPADLAAALKDPTTVVVFVSTSEDEFTAGHIPGARFVRYDQIAIDADGLSSELPPVDQLRTLLAAAGISDKSKVVGLRNGDRGVADVLYARLPRPPKRPAAERRP